MANLTEIRWHGRGGQGAKTAADFVAAAALTEGKFSQGFPDYGPERMGAPMRGFNRISDSVIRLHCAVNHPNVVVVLDPTLLDVIDVCEGLQDDGTLIVNTTETPADIKKKCGLKGNNIKVFTVDATQIALDEIKRPIPNTPMLGALVRVTELLKLETIFDNITKKFGKKLKEEMLKGNITAVKRAYEEVHGDE